MYQTMLLAAALLSAPQKPIQFQVQVRVVYLTVSARNAATNQFVADLNQGDFAVFENGREQEIVYFSPEILPVRIVLLMDMSNSMESRIMDVRDAALLVVRAMGSHDQAKVAMFHSHMLIIQDFTSDRVLLEKAVDSIPDGGETTLYTSLYVTLRELEQMERQGGHTHRSAIIVLTDGKDTKSLHTADEVLQEARASDVVIYSVLMPPLAADPDRKPPPKTEEELTAEWFMRRIAEDTGGRIYQPESVKQLQGAYTNIAQEVAVQYSIGYRPSADPDGTFRMISVQTPAHENVVLRHRRGYHSR